VKALADLAERSDKVALRSCLAAAQLSPSFLAGLADNSIKDASTEAEHFRLAIGRYSAARKRMIVSNLRLVISVVKRYQGFGLPFEDLVQEGNIGLMKAVDRYDWRRGFRFSTYATWWIRQQATRAVADMGKTIRTPVHVHNTMLRIKHEADELERDAGCAPTRDVLAQRLSMNPGKLAALIARMEEPVPLHLPDSSGTAPGDSLVDDSVTSNPSALAERAALISILERMLAELDPRDADVLVLRFGLEDGDALTLEEIGVRYDLTRERIRQIEASALRKLVHPIRANILREFIGPPKKKPRKSDDANSNVESRPSSFRNGQDEIDGNSTEEVIARLQVCGAEVFDGRASGGQIVVRNLWNTPQTRTLIHSLLDVGFKPYPGMEYRK
jgi:RNA polymerase primary sigma factor